MTKPLGEGRVYVRLQSILTGSQGVMTKLNLEVGAEAHTVLGTLLRTLLLPLACLTAFLTQLICTTFEKRRNQMGWKGISDVKDAPKGAPENAGSEETVVVVDA